jgi:hypothetical protein
MRSYARAVVIVVALGVGFLVLSTYLVAVGSDDTCEIVLGYLAGLIWIGIAVRTVVWLRHHPEGDDA